MPILKNQRHELFAQGLAAGKTADEAYKEAGYAENRCNASRLKTNENIVSRVSELQGRIATGVVITRQWVLQELVDTYKAARKEKQTGAANRSLKLLGMEAVDAAMFVERKEVGPAGAFDKMSTDELRDYVRHTAAQLGLGDEHTGAPRGNGKAGGKPH